MNFRSDIKTTDEKGVVLPEHTLWRNVIKRCFSKKYKSEKPTYENVTLDNDWYYFSKFLSDLKDIPNYSDFIDSRKGINKYDYQLDKDILSNGEKKYSKNNCCFVPRDLNMLLTKPKFSGKEVRIGVHKEKKSGLYEAYLSDNGVKVSLGRYSTEEEAFMKYKTAKESLIKRKAEFYFNLNLISEKVYCSLINYEIN